MKEWLHPIEHVVPLFGAKVLSPADATKGSLSPEVAQGFSHAISGLSPCDAIQAKR
jgi:hypothetical protein